MGSRLTDNLNSLYFSAANKLKSNKKKKKVIAYVEGYEDVFFWRDILSEFETDNLMFEVCLPSRSNLARGKKSVLMNYLGDKLGKSMIACVDADYDWLMQGSSEFCAKYFMNNPYVIHTYVYAIENFQCYAPSLHNVCVMATLNDREYFSFEDYLKAYSRIIYDLFLWSIWFHRQKRGNDFSITTFNNIVTINNLNTFHPEVALEKMRRKVNHELNILQRKYPEAKSHLVGLSNELYILGVNPDNTYLFVNGHHLMGNVVMQALTPICNILRRQRETEIKRLAVHRTQMNNELSSYDHSQIPIEQIIRRNTEYKASPQYKQIENDINRLIARITGSPTAMDEGNGEEKDLNLADGERSEE